jgi:hypothetical protein
LEQVRREESLEEEVKVTGSPKECALPRDGRREEEKG